MNLKDRKSTTKTGPRTLLLRLTPERGQYDEAATISTGWDLIDRFRLDRLIVTIEPVRQANPREVSRDSYRRLI